MNIEVRKLTMKELFAIKGETGRSLLTELPKKGADALDEQMYAALVWVVRRRTEPDLAFDDVLNAVTWNDLASGGEIVIDFGEPPPLDKTSSTTSEPSPDSAGSTPSVPEP